jgi:hypothetical protein
MHRYNVNMYWGTFHMSRETFTMYLGTFVMSRESVIIFWKHLPCQGDFFNRCMGILITWKETFTISVDTLTMFWGTFTMFVETLTMFCRTSTMSVDTLNMFWGNFTMSCRFVYNARSDLYYFQQWVVNFTISRETFTIFRETFTMFRNILPGPVIVFGAYYHHV